MNDEHKAVTWYWEAESEHCPHGPEPEDDTTDQWEEWTDRHVWSPQDIRICLDAPMGDHCNECSADHNEPVPWSACDVRKHARSKQGVVPNPGSEHQPVIVLVGTLECLDRECDDYFTEDGDEDHGIERCSHIHEEQVCSCQRQNDGEYNNTPCPMTSPAPATA